jgi:excisionase family DNA binding protein
MTERWLSVEEIAAHLGVSKETIYRWLEKEDEKRRIPANRIGRFWKFKASQKLMSGFELAAQTRKNNFN